MLLTPEEVNKLCDTSSKAFLTYDEYEPFLKAQHRKDVEWLNEHGKPQLNDSMGEDYEVVVMVIDADKWQAFKEGK